MGTWIIYSDINNIISYANIRGDFFDGNISSIKIETSVSNVFINYNFTYYEYGGLYIPDPILCYTTSNGVYKINQHTNLCELITSDADNYMVNTEYLHGPINIKSARKINN